MSNIIGEGFDDYVKKQIDVRQKVLGKTTRTSEDLVYLNSKTAWLRLVSSININSEYFSKTNPNPNLQNKTGDILAKNFILFGGVSNESGSLATGNFGAGQSDVFNNQTYGLGGISDYGFKPMSGLNSAKIVSYNRGSLRKATIRITANNPQQFYIIDTLYMKLGYTVLLEWGWTIYKDNKGENKTAPDNTVFNTFLKGTTFNNVLTELEKTRVITSGNQDGFIGYVTNFRWSFNQDGLYDIEIDVVSIGSVIESLNINKIYPIDKQEYLSKEGAGPISSFASNPQLGPSGPAGSSTPQPSQIASNGSVIVDLNNQLPQGVSVTPTGNTITTISTPEGGTTTIISDSLSNKVASPSTNIPVSSYLISRIHNFLYGCELKMSNTSDIYVKTGIEYIDSKYINPLLNAINGAQDASLDINLTDDKLSNFIYIKLGALLDFINNELLIYNQNSTNVISIDTNDPNKFYLPPLSLSGDPLTCIIPFMYYDGVGNYIEYKFNDVIGYDVKSKDNLLSKFDGNLMHLYVGLSKIEEVYLSSFNEDDKLTLYTFLENLMSCINRALGSINNFEVIYEDVTNLVKIIDTTNIPGIITKPSSTINVNGVYKDNSLGSFVRNISLNSELSNQIASSIAIGAQARGIKIPQDSTSFSKWYQGLEDRIIPYKLDSDDVKKGIITQVSGSIEDQLSSKYSENLNELKNFIEVVYNNLEPTSPNLASLQALNSEVTQYRNGLFIQNDIIGIQGFIPLNLSLTMDGISGMKIYQKFKITQDILPPIYPNKLNFLIKGIDHEIDKSGWRTNIQTLSIGTDQEIKTELLPKITSKPKENLSYFENFSGIIERIVMYAWSVGITDKYQIAAILTVAASESGMGQFLVEKASYMSVTRIRQVFGGYPQVKALNDTQLQSYVNNPKILNLIYGGINGNNKLEDGFNYRGRGLNHVTFYNGYNSAQNLIRNVLAPRYFAIDDLLTDNKLNNNVVKYGYLNDIDLIKNPGHLNKYTIELSPGQLSPFVATLSPYPHLAIIVLVLGKKIGAYGKPINSINSFNNSTGAIVQTNNGGGSPAQVSITQYQPNRDYFFSDESLGKIIEIQNKWKPYISSTGAGSIVSETPNF